MKDSNPLLQYPHTVDIFPGMGIMGSMTDREAVDFLAEKIGSYAVLARVLRMSPQAINNWRDRGISSKKRPAVWAMINDHGGHLSRDWLFERAA